MLATAIVMVDLIWQISSSRQALLTPVCILVLHGWVSNLNAIVVAYMYIGQNRLEATYFLQIYMCIIITT